MALGSVSLAVAVTVAPLARACPAGSYAAKSGDCVEDPDSSASGVTAICKDGSDSHSETRQGTCSGRHGVAEWCPCGATAGVLIPKATGSDKVLALAVVPLKLILSNGVMSNREL